MKGGGAALTMYQLKLPLTRSKIQSFNYLIAT